MAQEIRINVKNGEGRGDNPDEDNFFSFGRGANKMFGLGGNDIYVFDNRGDSVVEIEADRNGDGVVDALDDDGGIDEILTRVGTVKNSFDMTVGDFVFIENLTVTKGKLSVIGNALGNLLKGFTGNDTLDGGLGADSLVGGRGNDTYRVDDLGDLVDESVKGGIDAIEAKLSWSLTAQGNAQVENLLLLTGADPNASDFFGEGNALNNRITGNAGRNLLTGLVGNDQLIGEAGDDTLDGGEGRDRMSGGTGNDVYFVDSKLDKVIEAVGSGTDRVESSVDFRLAPTVENLRLIGSADLKGIGNNAANVMFGNAGNNTLDGAKGFDFMAGGAGNDTYILDTQSDEVREFVFDLPDFSIFQIDASGAAPIPVDAGGIDTIVLRSGEIDLAKSTTVNIDPDKKAGTGDEITVSFERGQFIENVRLEGVAKVGQGNALDNFILGNALTNGLEGRDGNDTLNGGAGADTMIGGAGDDTYFVENFRDEIREDLDSAVGGIDTVFSTRSVDLSGLDDGKAIELAGKGIENVTLLGKGALKILGDKANNHLVGNAGKNLITGDEGNDTIEGGAGTDALFGGKGFDVAAFTQSTSGVTVNLGLLVNVRNRAGEITDSFQSASRGHAQGDRLHDFEGVIGSRFADVLSGSNDQRTPQDSQAGNGANLLDGRGGDDVLSGGSGRDTLFGGEGDDILDGGADQDEMVGGAGNDSYVVDSAGDKVLEAAGAGNDRVQIDIDTPFDFAIGAFEHVETINVANSRANRIGISAASILTDGIDLDGDGVADTDLVIETDADGERAEDGVLTAPGSDALIFDAAEGWQVESLADGTRRVFIADETGAVQRSVIVKGDADIRIEALPVGETLVGGPGDDAFVVDHIDDAVIEEAGGGTDTVRIDVDAPFDFAIGDFAHVEIIDANNNQANRIAISVATLQTDGVDINGEGLLADLVVAADGEPGLDVLVFDAADGWQVEDLVDVSSDTRRVFLADENGTILRSVVVIGDGAEILIA